MIKMDLIFTVKGYYFEGLSKRNSLKKMVDNLDHHINGLRLEIGSYTNDERIREKQVFLSKSKSKKPREKEYIISMNNMFRDSLEQNRLHDDGEIKFIISNFDGNYDSDSIYILDYFLDHYDVFDGKEFRFNSSLPESRPNSRSNVYWRLLIDKLISQNNCN